MSVINEMLDLLEVERNIILSGELLDLERILDTKNKLIGHIMSSKSVSVSQLENLAAVGQRNTALLEAAGRGLKSAIRQVEDAKSLRDHTTYAHDGQRQALARRTATLKQNL